MLSPQGVLQGGAKAAEEPQVGSQALIPCQEELLNEDAGNGSREQDENLCLPACLHPLETLAFPHGPQSGPGRSLNEVPDITVIGHRSK